MLSTICLGISWRLRMMKDTRAEISIDLGSKKRAMAIHEALKPETKYSAGPRSKVGIRSVGRNLIVTMHARDVVALRAAMNSYLRWIASSVDLTQIVDQARPKHLERT